MKGSSQAYPGIARFSAFHSRISVQSTPKAHPLAQKISRARQEGEIRKAFCTNALRIWTFLKHRVSVQRPQGLFPDEPRLQD